MFPRAANTKAGFGLRAATGPTVAAHWVKKPPARQTAGCAENAELVVGPLMESVGEPSSDDGSKFFRHQQTVYSDASGKRGGLRRAAQLKRTPGEPAHADRIADAHLIGTRGDVVVHWTGAIAERATELKITAASLGADVVEDQTIGVEDEIAGPPGLSPVGKSPKRMPAPCTCTRPVMRGFASVPAIPASTWAGPLAVMFGTNALKRLRFT